MRISSVNMNYKVPKRNGVQFQGKNTCAKTLAALFGGAAAAGAIGGSILMSGGLAAIPWIAAYIGIGAGSGALIGHSIDKGSKQLDKKA